MGCNLPATEFEQSHSNSSMPNWFKMPSKRRTAVQRKREMTSVKTADSLAVDSQPRLPRNSHGGKEGKAAAVAEFEKLFFEHSAPCRPLSLKQKYSYTLSENYQNIEKLLSSVGKSLKARSTFAEFHLIEEMSRRKISKDPRGEGRARERKGSYASQGCRTRRGKGVVVELGEAVV